jgi:hypothetical protein
MYFVDQPSNMDHRATVARKAFQEQQDEAVLKTLKEAKALADKSEAKPLTQYQEDLIGRLQDKIRKSKQLCDEATNFPFRQLGYVFSSSGIGKHRNRENIRDWALILLDGCRFNESALNIVNLDLTILCVAYELSFLFRSPNMTSVRKKSEG